jgi:hypothetical protein
MRNNKILVINPKGGVGKTTSSIQLFGPFLAKKYNDKTTPVYEFDDENWDESLYNNSEVIKRVQQKIAGVDLDNAITDILLQDSHCVLDIGANKTSTSVFQSLVDTGLFPTLSLIAIPISDGKQDVINATNIYNQIKEVDEDIPIIFVLSRYVYTRELELQFDIFFETLMPSLQPQDRSYITLVDSDVVKFSSKTKLTIVEMANDTNDYAKAFKEALRSSGTSDDDLKKISIAKKRVKLSQDYLKEVLEPSFELLEDIVK